MSRRQTEEEVEAELEEEGATDCGCQGKGQLPPQHFSSINCEETVAWIKPPPAVDIYRGGVEQFISGAP